ncbi:MAG: aminotransferase class I/II-fold pyridoxal phosphate-dependent enzyme [Candidatus Omnitrophica bacterium]|nr:aminotransferase class I/II-fold pyridoxal phosphate-dependent enzyme [Candidatus Omnitrophota bacterium]
MKIPITRPSFDQDERAAILKPLETGWLVQGPCVQEFEQRVKAFTRASYALATSSCTTALHLALEALGVGAGDKVIVPSFTYIASANAVEYTGAQVVFCDIALDTFNISPLALRRMLAGDRDKEIKAVMPVNLFGLCASLPEIMEIARSHGAVVIEDSACGLGASIDGVHSGTFGAAGCFSFHPRKLITTGEGGMLISSEESVARRASSLRDHGASKSDLDRHGEKGGSLLPEFNLRGYNYRMTDMQGALGVVQMGKLDRILSCRREIARRYTEAFTPIPALSPPSMPSGYQHSYQSYVCLFTDGEDLKTFTKEKIDALNIRRNKIMSALEEKGISTRQGTHAVHTLGYYKNKYALRDEDFLASYAADRLSIALPLYPSMTDEEFDYVVTHIKKAIPRCAV